MSSSSSPEFHNSPDLNEQLQEQLQRNAMILDEDPAMIYTLYPPQSLLRAHAKLVPVRHEDLERRILDVERERVEFALSSVQDAIGQPLDAWFIGTRYVELMQQRTHEQGDDLAAFELKQQAFAELVRMWDEYHSAERKSRDREKRNHLSLLKTIQFLTDRMRATYHEACEAKRRERINAYEQQKLELMKQSELTNTPQTEVATRSKLDRRTKSPSSGKSNKTRSSSRGRSKR